MIGVKMSEFKIKDRTVLIDEEMRPFLSLYTWHIRHHGHNFYAMSSGKIAGKQFSIAMHRLLTGFSNLAVDHINGDGLDNRLVNLRLCTPTQNKRNCRSHKGARSQYKGVTWKKESKSWNAAISFENKSIWLGSFADEIEAARAYDEASRKYHGQYGRTNF